MLVAAAGMGFRSTGSTDRNRQVTCKELVYCSTNIFEYITYQVQVDSGGQVLVQYQERRAVLRSKACEMDLLLDLCL